MTTLTVPTALGNFVSGDLRALAYRLAAAGLMCASLAILTDSFMTPGNLLNVLRQTSLLFLMASGLTVVVLAGGLDLSVGANVGLSVCLAASVMKATGSIGLGVMAGIGCGTTIGFINGLLITMLRMPPFIATYGMLWVLHGITFYFMAGATIHGFPPVFRALGSGYWLGVPIPVYLMMVFLAIGAFFTQRTTFGQEVYAIGANRVAARLSGIPVIRRQILVYTLSGAMAGLASLVYLARLNSAEADIGEALTLPAIAAVLIGGTSLFGGLGTISGTLVGALILTLVLNGMNLLTINANLQPLVTGLIVILAVYIDMRLRKREQARG